MEKRITPEEYDKVASKFVSEYGYIGPCCRTTIERYHDGEPVERYSDLWNWHNNTFEKETVAAGIRKHYLEPEGLDLDDYLLYASLVQALMYGYSLESIRVAPNCSGSLFWMYDDCWGEVGWTIIDYYLFRKPSYYAVKRAFAPHRFTLRRAGDEVIVYGVNDTLLPVSLDVEYGYLGFDGAGSLDRRRVTVAAASKGEVLRFPIVDRSGLEGIHLVRPADSTPTATATGFTPATLRQAEFRRLLLPTPKITVSKIATMADGGAFTVSSDCFAHAVHFALPDGARYSDAWFDLLPGESRRVEVRGVEGALDTATIGAAAVL
jgi:beta-mannosidase